MGVRNQNKGPEALLEVSPPSFSNGDAAKLAKNLYGCDVIAKVLGSERDQNFCLTKADGLRLLLKIANAAEDVDSLRFENGALRHIAQVAPQLPIPRLISMRDGEDMAGVEHDGQLNQVRIISWLGGRMLRDARSSPQLRRLLGASLAELGLAMRGFFHRAADRTLLWDIRNTPSLVTWLDNVDDTDLRSLCADVIAEFGTHVLPKLSALRGQVIHNDFNPSNVMVSEEDQPSVTGILDFGDMIHAPLVCDVAVGASYHSSPESDPLLGIIEFVAGYHRVCPLEIAEAELLFDLICARHVTTLVVTSWRAKKYPKNRDYILRNATKAGESLRLLREIGREQATKRLRSACTTAHVPNTVDAPADKQQLVARREALLGPAYRLFYKEPVHITRGDGVWLFDADGNTYLDAYNNVPMVGHCHPRVVRALCDQAATINTHTRYLHATVLDYAEHLLAMFPRELDRVMFSCSGTEANELALRIARACTGNEGVIVSQHAYHGNSTSIAQLSPAYESAEKQANWVETIAPPDTYRNSPDVAKANFLSGLDAAIKRLRERGIGPAALLLDAGFTSDGMFIAPDGCLKAAADIVRNAGGLYIADEVQAGFARFGTSLWGFQAHGITPDIVTLGKPIGNGHPIAATIANNEVLDEFANRARYFNTFGGNPVSAAVGLAVLKVFQEDGLEENSRSVGEYLHRRLADLKDRFDIIGDVRGSGLFAGVELVTDRSTKHPATSRTDQVVNEMRKKRVLISMIGPRANVLKIRPPLPFQRQHVDQLMETLERVI